VQIGDKKETLLVRAVLEVDELFERAEIIANMELARGPDAGNDSV